MILKVHPQLMSQDSVVVFDEMLENKQEDFSPFSPTVHKKD